MRVLLFSSFAGSSRYIKPLLPLLKRLVSVVLVAEGVGADTLSKDGIKVDHIIQTDINSVRAIFDLFMPEVVFVVPQFNGSIEELAIQEAKKRRVYCVAGVDHWSLYKERFSKTDNDGNVLGEGLEYMPDKILLNDNIAYEDSVNEGIPDIFLSVVGNPVLETRWKNITLEELNKYEINKPNKTILFISEPYSERIPVNNKHYPGFSEIAVLEDILWAMPEDALLLIKPHPAESVEKFIPIISQRQNCELCIDDDIDHVLLGADKIVGMGSMLLLEVALIRQPVVSYRPHERVAFIGNRLNFTEKIIKKEDLKQALLCESSLRTQPLADQYSGSAKNIVDSIVALR